MLFRSGNNHATHFFIKPSNENCLYHLIFAIGHLGRVWYLAEQLARSWGADFSLFGCPQGLHVVDNTLLKAGSGQAREARSKARSGGAQARHAGERMGDAASFGEHAPFIPSPLTPLLSPLHFISPLAPLLSLSPLAGLRQHRR